jgi:hypothetical protein
MITIYIGNLPDDTDTAQVRSLFEPYGSIASVRMTPGGSGHRFDGFGLVEMDDAAAGKAIEEINGRLFGGAILSVREATETQDQDDVSSREPSVADEEPPSALMRRSYEVREVQKVDIPGQEEGEDWYRYVLASGASQITGFHRGTLEEVSEYAADCALAINERSVRGKTARPLTPARKKQA